MAKQTIRRRTVSATSAAWPQHVHPVLQRIYAARGIENPSDIEHRLARLLNPNLLGGMDVAVDILIKSIQANKRITVAGDYDCDGATGAAVAVRGLRLLGATDVHFIVPDRFVHGYGLTPELVNAMDPGTEVIVTVDSGTSSFSGVKAAKEKGLTVVITDHHLPGEGLPIADAIVNPNLDGETFPSKMLAGVGVMFYLLIAMRGEMRNRGIFLDAGPDLSTLLDLVALGTVADLVPLDFNNRILVDAGLRRIRSGQGNAGIKALMEIAELPPERLIASNIAFGIAPRLNAAGRLENMSLGVETLLSDDLGQARVMVRQLDAINKERKEMQAEMVNEAERMVATAEHIDSIGVVVFDPSWHAGVVGLVASKLKENLHRPVIAFAPAGEGSDEVRGSGRSISGFHLRDALAVVDAKNPGLMPKFGGHAMAAGLSLKMADVPRFAKAFDEVATKMLDEETLQAVLFTDGELPAGHINIHMAYYLREAGPFGQGFPEPMFDNEFEVVAWRTLGAKGISLALKDPRDGAVVSGTMFFADGNIPPPTKVRAAFEIQINTWMERDSLKLLIRHLEPI
jgi:single-stranded-DNA-specific exonuclease